MYSEEDVRRLALLAEATRSGKSISRLAHLDNITLRSLATVGPRAPKRLSRVSIATEAPSEEAQFFRKRHWKPFQI
jgi:hypothetical protein